MVGEEKTEYIDTYIIYIHASKNSSREGSINSCTAAVFSTSGGMGRKCDKLVRQIVMNLSQKRG